MVDADYYMKRITNGLVDLNIPGFTSLSDLRLNNIKKALNNNPQINFPVPSMNRFWFYPGENSYLEDKGNVFIKKCKVKLLTEEEFLTKSGAIAATGHTDTLAQDFADNFTEKYDQIAKKEPIYTKLESLYRFVSFAKLIKNNNALSKANFSIDYFLRKFPITYTNVDPTLPGIPNANVLNASNGKITTLSCGGVSIDMSTKVLNIVKDSKYISGLSNRVLKVRLFPNALYWNY